MDRDAGPQLVIGYIQALVAPTTRSQDVVVRPAPAPARPGEAAGGQDTKERTDGSAAPGRHDLRAQRARAAGLRAR